MIKENWFTDVSGQTKNMDPVFGDIYLLGHFLKQVGPFLKSLIDTETTNFKKLLNNDEEFKQIMIAYDEAMVEMEHELSFNFSGESIYSELLYEDLKLAGLTQTSLRVKLNLVRKLWDKLYNYLVSIGSKMIDLIDDAQVKLLRKILSFLNSLLASVASAAPGVEAMKEFKDVLEGFIDVLEE